MLLRRVLTALALLDNTGGRAVGAGTHHSTKR
jgi:hypothetical protein